MENTITETVPRQAIATFDQYEDAQALVDRLADEGFPVEHLAIVGTDLRYVEKVTGKLNAGRAALMGAGGGAAMGALVGLLFALLFSPDVPSMLAIVLYWGIVGVIAGVAVGLITYAMSGGRRDFTSVATMQAGRYEVLADDSVVNEALQALERTSRSTAASSAP